MSTMASNQTTETYTQKWERELAERLAKTPDSLQKAQRIFATAKHPAMGKPIANNTRLYRHDEQQCYAIRLHQTDVVTFHDDGRVTLNSGGWNTVTTRDRMSAYSPISVFTDKGVWYARHDEVFKRAKKRVRTEMNLPDFEQGDDEYPDRDTMREYWKRVDALTVVPYFDGITFGPKGKCLNGPSPKVWAKYLKDRAEVGKQIRGYVQGYMNQLVKGMPMPSGADCWYCCGVAPDHGDHLESHIEERYYVPSLAVNALRERGYRDMGVYMFLAMNADEQTMGGERFSEPDRKVVSRAIRDYLLKRLIPSPTNK